MCTPFVTTSFWGASAEGKPNKKQQRPQEQEQDRSAALAFNGIQAAQDRTAMSVGTSDGRMRTQSRKMSKNDAIDVTSTCMKQDATADERTAAHKMAVQIWRNKVEGIEWERAIASTSATAHRH